MRQEQKVKDKLLEYGLIEEYQEATQTGGLTVVCLTKEGKWCFAKPK